MCDGARVGADDVPNAGPAAGSTECQLYRRRATRSSRGGRPARRQPVVARPAGSVRALAASRGVRAGSRTAVARRPPDATARALVAVNREPRDSNPLDHLNASRSNPTSGSASSRTRRRGCAARAAASPLVDRRRGRRARRAACGSSTGGAAPCGGGRAASTTGGRFVAAAVAVEAEVRQGYFLFGFLRRPASRFRRAWPSRLAARLRRRLLRRPWPAVFARGLRAGRRGRSVLAAAAPDGRAPAGHALDEREPRLVADRVEAPDLGDRRPGFRCTAGARCRPRRPARRDETALRTRPKCAHCAIASRWLTDSPVSTSIDALEPVALVLGRQDEIRKHLAGPDADRRRLLVPDVDGNVVLPLQLRLQQADDAVVLELLSDRSNQNRTQVASGEPGMVTHVSGAVSMPGSLTRISFTFSMMR